MHGPEEVLVHVPHITAAERGPSVSANLLWRKQGGEMPVTFISAEMTGVAVGLVIYFLGASWQVAVAGG